MTPKNKTIAGVCIVIILALFVWAFVGLSKKMFNQGAPLSKVTQPAVTQKTGENTKVDFSAANKCLTTDFDKVPEFGADPNDVFYKIADIMSRRDESACDALGKDKDFCLKTYYQIVFLKMVDEGKNPLELLKDKSLINNNPDTTGQAVINNNLSLCEKITDPVGASSCKAIVSLDAKYCDFTNSSKTSNTCVVSDASGLSSGCSIDAVKGKTLCLNALDIAKAFKENKIEDCAQIDYATGSFTRLFCAAMLSPNSKNEINKAYRENVCYEKYGSQLAKENNDPSICEKIPSKGDTSSTNYSYCKSQFSK
jgi:hypothetical protein